MLNNYFSYLIQREFSKDASCMPTGTKVREMQFGQSLFLNVSYIWNKVKINMVKLNILLGLMPP
jgi:hypothetical protein